MNNKDIEKALGTGDPIYSKKHMSAVNFYAPAPYTQKRKQGLAEVPGGTQQNLAGNAFIEVAQGKTDVNTALRQLEEQLKAEIEKVRNK